MNSTRLTTILAGALLLASAAVAQPVNLFGFDTYGVESDPGSTDIPLAAEFLVSPGAQSGSMDRGAGITPSTFGAGYVGGQANYANLAEAIAAGAYISLNLVPQPGYQMTLESIVSDITCRTSNVDLNVAVFSGPTGYGEGDELDSKVLFKTSGGSFPDVAFDIADPALVDLIAPVEIRFYLWTSVNGEVGLGVRSDVGTANDDTNLELVVTGTVEESTAPLSIVTQPQSSVFDEGSEASLRVIASGGGLSYQWQTSPIGAGTWSDLSGETGFELAFSPVVLADEADYRVIVMDANSGVAISDVATVTVDPVPDIVPEAQLPELPYATAGAPYSHTLNATSGDAPLTWSAIGLPIGLVMDPGGVISGTPDLTTVGNAPYRVTVTVEDSSSPADADTQEFLLPFYPGTLLMDMGFDETDPDFGDGSANPYEGDTAFAANVQGFSGDSSGLAWGAGMNDLLNGLNSLRLLPAPGPDWPVSDTASMTADTWLGFTLAPASGYELKLDGGSVDLGYDIGGLGEPNFSLYVSDDGFQTSILAGEKLDPAIGRAATASIPMNGAALNGLSGPVEFRIYFWTPDGEAFFEFDKSSPIPFLRVRGEVVEGSVASGFAGYLANYPGLLDTTPGGDDDGDRIPLLFEYIWGFDPIVADGDPRVVAPVSIKLPGDELSFTYLRPASQPTDIAWIVQSSTDLSGWTTLTEGVDYTVSTQPSGGNLAVTVTLAGAVTGQIFARFVPVVQ